MNTDEQKSALSAFMRGYLFFSRLASPGPYGLATLQLPACKLPVAPAGEPADQNSDTIPQCSPKRALLFATTPIISFCKPAQLR